MQRHQLLGTAGKIGLLTLISRIFGYLRDLTLAIVLGAGFGMDSFSIAFRLANLFRRLFGEGTLSAAFVPVFTEFREQNTEKELWRFASKFFYTIALILAGLVVLQIVFAPTIVGVMAPGFMKIEGKWELTVFLNRIMAPFMFFIGLSAVLMSILHSLRCFAPSAASPIMFNVMIIFSAFTVAKWFDDPAIGIAIGVLFGGACHLFFQVPAAWKRGMRFIPSVSFTHPAIRQVSRLMIPGLFGIGIVQINLLVDALMASFLPEGSVSSLYYAGRVQELVLGIFTVSLATVILPELSLQALRHDDEKMKETLSFSLRMNAFITIPAMVGLVVLAHPIVSVLFQHGKFTSTDTERTTLALVFYALGLFSIGGIRMIVPAFYAVKDTTTPVKCAVVALGVNVIGNWLLMQPLKQGGIALATSIAATVNMAQLIWSYQKRFGPLPWVSIRESLIRIGVQSLAMALACTVFLNLFGFQEQVSVSGKAFALAGTIVLSVLIYFGAALLLKSKELYAFQQSPQEPPIDPSDLA